MTNPMTPLCLELVGRRPGTHCTLRRGHEGDHVHAVQAGRGTCVDGSGAVIHTVPATPSDPMVPNAPGWWTFTNADGGVEYGRVEWASGKRLVFRAVRVPGFFDVNPGGRWTGKAYTQADLDAARAEEREKLEKVTERLGKAGTAWHESQADLDDARARIAELEAKVAELDVLSGNIHASRVDVADKLRAERKKSAEARRAALREAADDADARASRQVAADSDGATALRAYAGELREKAEAAT